MESNSSEKITSKKYENSETTEETKTNPKENNESIKTKEISQKDKRIDECIIKNNNKPFEELDSKIMNVSKSVCKLKLETLSETIIGTGFLLKFYIDQEIFYCLMSNEHIIRKDLINNNNICILYDNENKLLNIKLDISKRYIKSFKDYDLDITTIEILDEDNIPKDYFLRNNLQTDNNRIINSEIYIPQYAQGKELVYARGKIIKIDNNEFTHLANTEYGSSGSPIFLKNSKSVIGIHKQGNVDKTENYGDFIYPAINIIKEDIKKKRSNGKYINGKYIYEDGKYYIGEFKNDIPNGKGIKYYPNDNILYDGNFVNGKFEGSGKYYYNDGKYFIGQYKNGLINGKGIKYYKNGKILYEGDFINDKYEGNGKYVWENGVCYIGQFKNGLRNGKGIEYYSNGNIKYEGDWINDKYEGSGKYIWENGKYYIGQHKNGFKHGKGILYYPNGNIKYEGIWINDKFDEN